MRWLALVVCCLPALIVGQEVTVGGRVDLELRSDREVTFDFGREAGVDLTFSQPGVLDAYFDYTVAGGDGRVQELYLSPPQTAPVVTVTLGRFLLPYGDPRTNVIDRYVDGGRDLFDTYDAWRRGNVFLDTDVTGLKLSREFGPVSADLVGAAIPDGDLCFQARLVGSHGGARGGGSFYLGRDTTGAAMRQAALHAGYLGHGLDVVGQLYLGEAAGGDHRGWTARAAWRLPRLPLRLFAAQTLYNDDRQSAVGTTRFGAEYQLDEHYRLEARYELTDAPAPNHDDRAVFRFKAVF